jgi:V8-like Glu-specific endopeptidase
MKFHRLTNSLWVASLVLLLAVLPLPITGAGAETARQLQTREVKRDPQSVREFWTKERMENAKPLSLLRLNSGNETSPEPLTLDSQSPNPQRIPSSAPAATTVTRTVSRIPKRLPLNRGTAELGSVTRGLASAERVVNPSAYPFSTHGRLFGVNAEGSYYCSATVIPSELGNAVWTAGHCLTLKGVWAESLEFVPAYDRGSAPFGEWAAESMATSNEWATYNNGNFDYGVMIMHPDTSGDQIADVVGTRGISFNDLRDLNFSAFGYPAAYPFNGETAWVCESPWLGDDPYASLVGESAMGIDCDMTPGSSGGGWITEDATGSYLNSVNSYSRPIYPDVMFGPYLGDDAESLWAETAGTPTPTPQPTPTDFVDTHAMRVSLRLSKHLIAKGTMTAPDGYRACTRNAPVGIYRKVPGEWKLLKVMSTNDFGSYKFRLKDRTGRYFVYSIDGYVDDLNYCTDAATFIKVHRH